MRGFSPFPKDTNTKKVLKYFRIGLSLVSCPVSGRGVTREILSEGETEVRRRCIKTGHPEKCIRQFAPTVERNAKFLSSPQKAGLYTAANAIASTGPHDGTATE